MGREKKRKRSRSNTPPVEWETLLVPPVNALGAPIEQAAAPPASSGRPRAEAAVRDQAGSSRERGGEKARGGDKGGEPVNEGVLIEAWRALVLNLAALRGDPQVERLLAEKHPELQRVAEDTGATDRASKSIEQAREAAKGWFEKGLRGSNRHGPAERAALCTRLSETLKARAAAILSELQGGALEAAVTALRRGKAEDEGPLICALISRELEGSRYEGIWTSRSGAGRYIIGDEDPASGLPDKDADGANIDRVIRVAVKITDGKLTIDGFFHKGETDMNPVKCQVGPFLTVYFEGLSLKEALAKWKDGPDRRAKVHAAPTGLLVRAAPGPVIMGGGLGQSNAQDKEREKLKALAATLPPGWELRESRSKKGTYYYANPAKGLSQHERPTA